MEGLCEEGIAFPKCRQDEATVFLRQGTAPRRSQRDSR